MRRPRPCASAGSRSAARHHKPPPDPARHASGRRGQRPGSSREPRTQTLPRGSPRAPVPRALPSAVLRGPLHYAPPLMGVCQRDFPASCFRGHQSSAAFPLCRGIDGGREGVTGPGAAASRPRSIIFGGIIGLGEGTGEGREGTFQSREGARGRGARGGAEPWLDGAARGASVRCARAAPGPNPAPRRAPRPSRASAWGPRRPFVAEPSFLSALCAATEISPDPG